MTKKWICNKCQKEIFNKPSQNSVCIYCKSGRFYALNECVICKKLFKPNNLKVQCCSWKCRNKLMSIKPSGKLGKTYPHLQRAKIKKCIVCQKTFRAIKDCHNRKQKYCSRECWAKRNPPEIKKCIYCSKEFKTYERKTKIYCSKKCYDLDKRERMKGKNSHLWKGGKTKLNKILRTRAEFREWRNKVFQRDKYICQDCNKKSTKGNRIYLNAHHLKKISLYPELIYEISNGITLCKECHLKRHSHKF